MHWIPQKKIWRIVIASTATMALLSLLFSANCVSIRNTLVGWFSPEYKPEGAADNLKPTYTGPDAKRKRLAVKLKAVAGGFKNITDVQFVPGRAGEMFVLEKDGRLLHAKVGEKGIRQIVELPVLTASEQGLLGLAFHPHFTDNGRFFLNYSLAEKGGEFSIVEEWHIEVNDLKNAKPIHRLMAIEQPYANHNAGQLAFGHDSMLYIGWGDGGWRDDPHDHGQNLETMLGSMLRVDVDSAKKPYDIPQDNPFIGKSGTPPETWAYGLRNPWRYSFDIRGRLVVADVGQNLWEEVSIVEAGGNYGWKTMEAEHCFPPKTKCNKTAYKGPVYSYGRDEGQSITGGFEYTGNAMPALRGLYVFGDFVSGRLWAIKLPNDSQTLIPRNEAITLGKWPILPSTFARDNAGEIYVANYADGVIYRLE